MKIRTMLAVAVWSLLAVGAAEAGWVFKTTTTGSGDPRAARAMQMKMNAWVDGEKTRMDFVESGNPMMPSGAYLLSTDGGKTAYMVNPKTKTYSIWDMEAIMGMAGGMMSMMNMKVTEPKVEKVGEEDGGKMAGYPTQHYSFRTTYGMEMNIFGMKTSTKHEMEQQIWSSDKLANIGAGWWFKQQGIQTGNKELDALIKAEQEKVKGFPLKRIQVTKTTDQNGKVTTQTSTTEVTDLREEKVDAAVFVLPKEFKEEPLFPAADGEGASGGKAGAGANNPFLKMMKGMGQK